MEINPDKLVAEYKIVLCHPGVYEEFIWVYNQLVRRAQYVSLPEDAIKNYVDELGNIPESGLWLGWLAVLRRQVLLGIFPPE